MSASATFRAITLLIALLSLSTDLTRAQQSGPPPTASANAPATTTLPEAPSCPAGKSFCDGMSTCQSLMSDPRNCGLCKRDCGATATCIAGQCTVSGDPLLFACQFTSGPLNGKTIQPQPTEAQLHGPAGDACTDNFGSSGTQVAATFACKFTKGPLAGKTVVPTNTPLLGPADQPCSDNFGNTGLQVSVN